MAGNGEQPQRRDPPRRPRAARDRRRARRSSATQNQTIKATSSRNGDTVIGDLAGNHARRRALRRATRRRTSALTAERARRDRRRRSTGSPRFLQQLRPTMVSLGNDGRQHDAGAARPHASRRVSCSTFFDDAGPFADASKPAFEALGKASVTGAQAVKAAGPTVTAAAHVLPRHARAGQQPRRSSCSTSTTATAPSRTTRAPRSSSARRQEAATRASRRCSVRLRPVDGDQLLRPERPPAERVNGFVSPCANYVDAATRAQKIAAQPGLRSAARPTSAPPSRASTAPDTSDKTLIRDGASVSVSDGTPTGAGAPRRRRLPVRQRRQAGAHSAGGAKRPGPRRRLARNADGHRRPPGPIKTLVGGAKRRPKVGVSAPRRPTRRASALGRPVPPRLPPRAMNRRTRGIRRRQSRARRRGHDARGRRRGVPRLQRQQRPAVRARRASSTCRSANGAKLVKGNEVREGGFRVGVVEDMTPVRLPNGTVGAELKLKLDKKERARSRSTRTCVIRTALGARA